MTPHQYHEIVGLLELILSCHIKIDWVKYGVFAAAFLNLFDALLI